MKLKEKMEAIRLRQEGKSYSEILRKVHVSKSTLSLWLRDVFLSEKQKERLYVTLRRKNAYKGAKAQQEKRVIKTKIIISSAKKEAKHFFHNPLFLSGLMLYWAEGGKSEDDGLVAFSNSDTSMIKLIMRWFRIVCKVPEHKFRVCVHMHTLHCRKDLERYWSRVTIVPLERFHKSQIKQTSLKHRKNQLYNGTCVIRICDVDLLRKIKGWRIGVLSKMGISIKNNKNNVPVA